MNELTTMHHIARSNRLSKLKEYDRMRDRFLSAVKGEDIYTPFVLDYCQIDHTIYQLCYGRSAKGMVYSVVTLNVPLNKISVSYFGSLDDLYIFLPFDERQMTKRYAAIN